MPRAPLVVLLVVALAVIAFAALAPAAAQTPTPFPTQAAVTLPPYPPTPTPSATATSPGVPLPVNVERGLLAPGDEVTAIIEPPTLSHSYTLAAPPAGLLALTLTLPRGTEASYISLDVIDASGAILQSFFNNGLFGRLSFDPFVLRPGWTYRVAIRYQTPPACPTRWLYARSRRRRWR